MSISCALRRLTSGQRLGDCLVELHETPGNVSPRLDRSAYKARGFHFPQASLELPVSLKNALERLPGAASDCVRISKLRLIWNRRGHFREDFSHRLPITKIPSL